MSFDIAGIGQQTIGIVREELGAAWDKLTPAERKLIQSCLEDLARLQLGVMTGSKADVEMAHVKAQLANIQSVSAELAKNAVLNAAAKIFKVGANIVLAAL